MKSVMSDIFSILPDAKYPRSVFNRSHGHKTTMDAGYLVPFYWDVILPGDTVNLKTQFLARFNTLKVPIMDNVFLDTFFFFVPFRLLWPNFVRMMGEQDNPDDSTDFTMPKADYTHAPLSTTGYVHQSLQDYLGIPPLVVGLRHQNLVCRAYNKIWNDWFRHQFLQDSVQVYDPLYPDGPDDPTKYVLLRRGKRRDYFTSGLPWPQKGDPVTLPLGQSAPIHTGAGTGAGSDISVYANNVSEYRKLAADQTYLYASSTTSDAAHSLYADLEEATASTINVIRQAVQLQRYQEMLARTGSRYVEYIRAFYGVICPDFRLQRSEYLGGGSTRVNVSPIAQTSATGATGTPQGNLAAMGVVNARDGFVKSFTEHGIVIGLMNVRADITYQQGLDKLLSLSSVFDLPIPLFSHLGEEPIYNKEIFAQGPGHVNPGTGVEYDDEAFAWQERDARWRYMPSRISGKFRSNTPGGSYDVYHLADDYSALPALDDDWIMDDPPIDRASAVTSEPHFKVDTYSTLIHTRVLPAHGTPGRMDHLF